MAVDPRITSTQFQWLCDEEDGWDTLDDTQLFSRDGLLQVREQTPDRSLLGASKTDWGRNDSNGMVGIAGDMWPDPSGDECWDENAEDNAAYRTVLNATVNKIFSSQWTPSVDATKWQILSFTFYDVQSIGRQWLIGNLATATTPQLYICADPSNPTYPDHYFFGSGFSAFGASHTEEFTTGVRRDSGGWHRVLMAGITTPQYDVRILVFDNVVVKNEIAAASSLALPGGNYVGGIYYGDYSSNPLYLDTVKCWNNATGRYKPAVIITSPVARPSSLTGLSNPVTSDITNEVDRHGYIFYEFAIVEKNQYGVEVVKERAELTDANLQAATLAGDGSDGVRLYITMASSSSFANYRSGLWMPCLDSVIMDFNRQWEEDDSPTATWTEDD